MVGLVVPSNDADLVSSSGGANASPFVIAAKRAGIKVIPSIINAVILTSAWSASNSNMMAGCRVLYGLAAEGRAPACFGRLNRYAVPWVAACLYGLFICLGYMTIDASASTAFSWLQDLVSISTLVNWITICITYLRFFYGMKAQGIDRKELPWAPPLQPYITWASLTMFLLLLITGGYATFVHGNWSNETFVSSYINIPLFAILYFGYKFAKKTKMIPLMEIPIQPFIDIYKMNPEPEAEPKKGWMKYNFLW